MSYYPTVYSGGGYTTAASRVNTPTSGFGFSTPPQTNNLNISASSRSLNPFGGVGTPNFAYADPSTLNRLNISNLIYSPSAGGYLYRNANYSGFGSGQWGGDPGANRQASQFYNYIGSLPTQERGSPALMQLQNSGLAGQPPPGPSWNQQISNFFSGASPFVRNMAQSAGFNPQGYYGPFTFGQQNNTNTNRFGLGY